jgi:putative membrane protein
MNSNFSHPQRQSLIGVLVMFTDTFQKYARAFLPIIAIAIIKAGQMDKLFIWFAIALFVVVIAIIAYLKYLNFTFFLDNENEEFVVRSGIFNKSRIAIPLDKIQQVNINQSFIQKIIRVHALEVDTAGGSGKEVTIRAISHHMALALKERLLETGYATSNNEMSDEASGPLQNNNHPFIQISLLSLLKTGITSNYARSFALLLAFVVTLFQYIEDFIEVTGYDNNSLDNYINAETALKFLLFIIIGIIMITLIINLGRTVIRYFNFRITKQQNSLVLSYGLLNTKSTIIRPEKVQIVTVGRNYFQKKFNINDIKIRQSSDSESNDKEQKKTAIEIPGCNNAEKGVLLQFLLEKIPERGVMLRPSIRKILMETIKFLVIPLSVFYIFAYHLVTDLQEYILFVPAYILFVSVMIYFAFRHSRLFVTDDFIIKQSGAWDIDEDYIAPHKIQAVSLKQFFWHKGSDIGIVTLHTAGGTISFGLANYTRLKELVNYWLYQVETSPKHWM